MARRAGVRIDISVDFKSPTKLGTTPTESNDTTKQSNTRKPE